MQNSPTIKHLDELEVRRFLQSVKVMEAIETAFRDRFPALTLIPRVHCPLAHGVLLIMSCYDPSRPVLGMKLVTVRNHLSTLQDRVNATYLLLDP